VAPSIWWRLTGCAAEGGGDGGAATGADLDSSSRVTGETAPCVSHTSTAETLRSGWSCDAAQPPGTEDTPARTPGPRRWSERPTTAEPAWTRRRVCNRISTVRNSGPGLAQTRPSLQWGQPYDTVPEWAGGGVGSAEDRSPGGMPHRRRPCCACPTDGGADSWLALALHDLGAR
jgi:hypothetical protein